MAKTNKPKSKKERCRKGTRKCPKIGECRPVFDLNALPIKKQASAKLRIQRRCPKGTSKCADKLKCYSRDENGNIQTTNPPKKVSELKGQALLDYKRYVYERRKLLRAEKAQRLANLPAKRMDPNLKHRSKNLEEIQKANQEYEDERSITTSELAELRKQPSKKTAVKPKPAATNAAATATATATTAPKNITKRKTRSQIAKQLMRKK